MSQYGVDTYGNAIYGPGIFDRMRRYVPREVYAENSLLMALLQVEAAEFDTIRQNLIDVQFQRWTETVSGWGLAYWENLLNLHPAATDTDDVRRARIQAARRGVGPPTRSNIESLATIFQNGEIDLIEDYAAFNVIIRFASALGIPSNLADFQNYIRSIVPAHLTLTYLFVYTTWQQWDAHNLLWSGTDALALSWTQHDVYG